MQLPGGTFIAVAARPAPDVADRVEVARAVGAATDEEHPHRVALVDPERAVPGGRPGVLFAVQHDVGRVLARHRVHVEAVVALGAGLLVRVEFVLTEVQHPVDPGQPLFGLDEIIPNMPALIPRFRKRARVYMSVLVVAKTATLGFGGVLTLLSYRAFRRGD
jgi:hypothetical protein